MTLETLVIRLAAAGLDANPHSILDALWLSTLDVDLSSFQLRRAPHPDSPDLHHPPVPTQEPESQPSQQEAGNSEQALWHKPPPSPSSFDLYGKGDVSGADITVAASTVLLPSARAIPQRLPLMRALRPFRQRWPSAYDKEVDEDATANLTAELRIAKGEGVFPALRPRRERWYEAHLILEDHPIIELWAAPMREFAQLLRDTGAFRLVRTWRLRLHSEEPNETARAHLESPAGGQSSTRVLAGDPRRLLFFASHGASIHWIDGIYARLLKSWGAGTVSLLHLLPRQRWDHTLLGVPHGLARAAHPGSSATALSFDPFWWRFSSSPSSSQTICIPAFPLEPTSVETWARMQMTFGRDAEAFIVDPTDVLSHEEAENVAPEVMDPHLALTNLRERSAAAFDLAIMLASAPFTLPVARLVQEVTQAGSTDFSVLAELMLSGVVVPRAGQSPIAKETTYYVVRQSIQPLLLRSLRTADAEGLAQALNQRVSEYLSLISGRPIQFGALIADADGLQKLPIWAHAFANLTGALQNRRPLHPKGRPWRLTLEALPRAILGRLARLATADRPLNREAVRTDLWQYVDDPRFVEMYGNGELRFRQEVSLHLQGILKKAPYFGLRILWVDDRPENNTSIAAQIERQGAEPITIALSTEEALGRPELQEYDVVISDMSRGTNDQAGYELLDRLQIQSVTAPVIIFAGYTVAEDDGRARVVASGAFAATYRVDELLHLLREAALASALAHPQARANTFKGGTPTPSTNTGVSDGQPLRSALDIPSGEFCSAAEIRQQVTLAAALSRNEAIVDQLLIFSTEQQHTWIVFSARSLIFVLDDPTTRSAQRMVQRVMAITQAVPITARISIDGEATVGFGSAELPRWYFSPGLFASPHAVEQSVVSRMLNSIGSDAPANSGYSDETSEGPAAQLQIPVIREQVRISLSAVGIQSASESAINVVIEAAKLRPAPGYREEISLSRLFFAAVLVGDRLAATDLDNEELRAFSLTLNTKRWQRLKSQMLTQFVRGSIQDAGHRLELGFSDNAREALVAASQRDDFEDVLSGDSLVRTLLLPADTFKGSLLYRSLPDPEKLRQDVISRKTALGGERVSRATMDSMQMVEVVRAGSEDIIFDDDPSETHGPFVRTRGTHSVIVPERFRIGGFPVKNSIFREFVRSGGYRHEEFWPDGAGNAQSRFVCKDGTPGPATWPSDQYPESFPDYPVAGISHFEALAFIAWLSRSVKAGDGMKWCLPSENMWEFAARGSKGLQYPWGSTFEHHRCNSREAGIGAPSPSGRFPSGRSPFGAEDFAGNVWEFVRASDSHSWTCVLRGGSFTNSSTEVKSSLRLVDVPRDHRPPDFGLRCALEAAIPRKK